MSLVPRGGAATAASAAKTDSKMPRAMTVEEIEAELKGANEVSADARKQKLAAVPAILDVLLVDDSDWEATIDALAKAGVKNLTTS